MAHASQFTGLSLVSIDMGSICMHATVAAIELSVTLHIKISVNPCGYDITVYITFSWTQMGTDSLALRSLRFSLIMQKKDEISRNLNHPCIRQDPRYSIMIINIYKKKTFK